MNLLGTGTFGFVFGDTSTVAVKGFQNDADAYWWELRILGLLQDAQYIVHTTHDITFATRRFMVNKFECFYGMERAQMDLEVYVRTHLRPTRAVIWSVMEDMSRALMELKKHRIVHMDIKPSNILYFERTQTWKLCDFGCARETTKDSHYVRPGRGGYDGQSWVGTYEFQSPESLYACISMMKERLPPAFNAYLSDVYSLGTTCIWAMTRGKYWNEKRSSENRPIDIMQAMVRRAKQPREEHISFDDVAGDQLSRVLHTMVSFLPRERMEWTQHMV